MSDVITSVNWINDAIFVSLVNTALQMTVLIPLIALFIWVFRIKSATTRYSLWLFALFAMVALPLLTPFIPRIDFSGFHHQRRAGYGLDDMMRPGMGAGHAGDSSEVSGSVLSTSAAKAALNREIDVSLINPVSIAYFIWCAGALFMLCVTVGVYMKLRKLRICSPDIESQAALEVLSRLRDKLGISRAVALKASSEIYIPMSMGIFSPVIVVPDSVMDSGSSHELEMVLAHELAHIRRWDYLVRLLQNVLGVVFFFHPLFHLMKRNLAREREHICDDWVIHVTRRRREYAECLVGLLEKAIYGPVNIPVTLAMAERKRDIPGRVDMIVDRTRKTAMKVTRRAIIIMLIIGFLSLPVIGGIKLVGSVAARTASDEGRIVYTQDLPLAICVMDADGQNKSQILDRFGAPSWSPDGRQIAFTYYHDDVNRADIYIMDADGKNRRNLSNMAGMYEGDPSWSPDGKRIAFYGNVYEGADNAPSVKITSGGLYVINTDGSNLRKLVEGPWMILSPDWSPDSSRIVFSSTQDSSWGDIYVIEADGGEIERLTSINRTIGGISWSPNGREIVFAFFPGPSDCEICVMDPDGENQVNITNTTWRGEAHPCWSPDGTKMAFVSNLDGEQEICIMDADGSNVRQLTDTPALEMWPDWTAFTYGVEPAGKLKSTWGRIKALLRPR